MLWFRQIKCESKLFCVRFSFSFRYQKNLRKEDPEKYEQLYGRRGPRRADGETPCPAERRHGGRRKIGEKAELETSAVVTTSEATAAEEVKT